MRGILPSIYSMYARAHALPLWDLARAVAVCAAMLLLASHAYAQEAAALPAPVAAPFIGAQPTVILTAVPQAVGSGGSATLTWYTENALHCAGSGFSTANATSGSVSVAPGTSTTYSITCTGLGGGASTSTIVTRTPATSGGSGSGGSGGGGNRSSVSRATPTYTPSTSSPDSRWVHTMLTPDELQEARARGYGVPYVHYGVVTAPVMKVYATPAFVVLTAGLGSRLQTVHPTFMIMKNGVWHTVAATGIWPREANGRYRGKAYYILRLTDPLYAPSGKYIADVDLSLPGCVDETCTMSGWRLQGWQL